MTRDVLKGSRFLAVSLIAPGELETAERPAVARIAGVGEVMMAHELPDGRFNLVLRGRARIRIDEELAHGRARTARSRRPCCPICPCSTAPSCATPSSRCARSSASSPTPSPRAARSCARSWPRRRPPAELVDVLTAQLVYDPALRQRLLETREVDASHRARLGGGRRDDVPHRAARPGQLSGQFALTERQKWRGACEFRDT